MLTSTFYFLTLFFVLCDADSMQFETIWKNKGEKEEKKDSANNGIFVGWFWLEWHQIHVETVDLKLIRCVVYLISSRQFSFNLFYLHKKYLCNLRINSSFKSLSLSPFLSLFSFLVPIPIPFLNWMLSFADGCWLLACWHSLCIAFIWKKYVFSFNYFLLSFEIDILLLPLLAWVIRIKYRGVRYSNCSLFYIFMLFFFSNFLRCFCLSKPIYLSFSFLLWLLYYYLLFFCAMSSPSRSYFFIPFYIPFHSPFIWFSIESSHFFLMYFSFLFGWKVKNVSAVQL